MEELWQSNYNIYIYTLTYNVFSHDEYMCILQRTLFEKLLKLLKLINLIIEQLEYIRTKHGIFISQKLLKNSRSCRHFRSKICTYSMYEIYSRSSTPTILFQNVRQTIETSRRIRRREDRIHSIFYSMFNVDDKRWIRMLFPWRIRQVRARVVRERYARSHTMR